MAVVSGLAGAGASIFGATQQADSAKDAQDMQWKMFNTMRSDLSPFMQGGAGAFAGLSGLAPGMTQNLGAANSKLADLLGLGSGGSAGALSSLQSMPGYQFAQQQGQQGLDRSLAARGLGLSGASLTDSMKFNQGLAEQNYNNVVGQLMGYQGQGFGQLMGMSQLGANAAAGVGSAGMGAATNAGEAGMWGAQQFAGGLNAGMNDMFGSKGGFTGLNWGDVSQFLSDRAAKEEIRKEGKLPSGLPVYTFRYKGSDLPRLGVMADEAERVSPASVSRHASGLKQVNYDAIARLPARSKLPPMRMAA